jgi:hypothetical protein
MQDPAPTFNQPDRGQRLDIFMDITVVAAKAPRQFGNPSLRLAPQQTQQVEAPGREKLKHGFQPVKRKMTFIDRLPRLHTTPARDKAPAHIVKTFDMQLRLAHRLPPRAFATSAMKSTISFSGDSNR